MRGLPESFDPENAERVTVSLWALFNHVRAYGGTSEDGRTTMNGFDILRESNHGYDDYARPEDYYDLYPTRMVGLRLCCDGEECYVVRREQDGSVVLICAENVGNEELEDIDTTFTLTEVEFNAATGGAL